MNVKNVVKSIDNNSDGEERDRTYRKLELDAQMALDETGFGRFNYKVVIVIALTAINVPFNILAMGFVLTPAACDFNMTTIDKARLSTSLMFGMVVGSCIWGGIADTRGRRISLLICLFLQGFVDVASSIVPNYWAFLILKFASGVQLSGQTTIPYTYLGEFQPTKYRERILSLMEIPLTLGLTFAPVLAWTIIPLEFDVTYSFFTFKSWNLFVVMCALPSLIYGCLLLKLPETPKYLAVSGRYTDLRKVLTAMYHENTGNAPEEYNFAKLKAAGIMFFTDQTDDSTIETIGIDGSGYGNITIINFIKTLYKQTRMLLQPPYISRTLITCLDTYLTLACLHNLTLWVPELFERFAAFEEKHPDEVASLCIVSNSFSQSLNNNKTTSVSSQLTDQAGTANYSTIADCDSTIDTEVFIYTSIIGLSSLPVAIIYPFCVNRLGFRFSLVFCSFIGCGVTVALLFVTSSTENLILSCIYEALMSVCVTSVCCLIVELFPTNLRVTASALSPLFGRIGAFVGNALFGYLIDDNCIVLISIVAGEIFLAGVLALFLPKRNQSQSNRQPQATSNIPNPEVQSESDEHSPASDVTATASALSSLFGRVGALIGNATFSYLIDDNCIVLISIITVQVFLTGVLALFLPKRGQSKKQPQATTVIPEPEILSKTNKPTTIVA